MPAHCVFYYELNIFQLETFQQVADFKELRLYQQQMERVSLPNIMNTCGSLHVIQALVHGAP